ncbi:hypothetical protein JTI58_22485 [Lysinibacillus fusiformis]|nr:hypothetical protein [Lysinibacillus fusiformis]QSB09711.1 hypothetical protein JTI58_22485 [Lysinibacillus fusiformis]
MKSKILDNTLAARYLGLIDGFAGAIGAYYAARISIKTNPSNMLLHL